MDLLAAFTKTETRWDSYQDFLNQFSFNGIGYTTYPFQTLRGNREEVDQSFRGYIAGGYQSNGIVFTLEMIRMLIFAEARPMYRRLVKGRPGELFSSPSLNMLRNPGPGQTAGKLMARAILDADLGGNHFAVRRGNRIKRMRPDWVTIILGVTDEVDPDIEVVDDLDAEVVGYLYHPGGPSKNSKPVTLPAGEVAHWAPIPDPTANYRGMSWLTPVVREISGDKQAGAYKNQFYENGATPNLILTNPITDVDTFNKWVALFREEHEGVANAYKTLILGGGMDAEVVGRDFQQMDFKAVQGAGETRIAAASGVGAVLAGFSEGLQGSSLNTGNFGANRRKVADIVFRPLWHSFFDTYTQIVTVPRGAELWCDEPGIAFLREDAKDAAEIQQIRGTTIRNLVDAGFTPDSVIDAVANDDMTLLDHTDLFSVQLQPPGTEEEPSDPEPAAEPDEDPPTE